MRTLGASILGTVLPTLGNPLLAQTLGLFGSRSSDRDQTVSPYTKSTASIANEGGLPEAPAFAVRKLLDRTGLTMADMAVVKNHNPFAVNDVIFSKLLDYDWHDMNNTGSPLVWGHPQGPTLTRVAIEAFEEAVDLGGGHVLVFGCAAGDVGIASIFKVS